MKRAIRMIVLCVACSLATPIRADELHLAPGVIEGRVVEESSNFIRIETATGTVAVPASVIKLRVAGPSRMERYAAMQAAEPLTPARHAEIAGWCFQAGLADPGDRHLEAALAADPRCEAALTLAGYIRLGDLWLKAGAPPTANPPKGAGTPPATMLDTLRTGWHRRLNTLFESMAVDGPGGGEFEAARAQILAIREPTIIPIVSRVLEPGGPAIRLVLVEVLSAYPEEAATLHLTVLAVLDTGIEVRKAAMAAIGRRPGRKPADWLRAALTCENEVVVGRAAQALGWLKDRSAMPDLVDHLSTGRGQPARITVGKIFDDLGILFDKAIVVPLGHQAAEIPSEVAFVDYRRRIDRLARRIERPSGAFRTEVQDALSAISGENFGFDVTAWREWVARNPPIDAGAP